VRPSRRRIDGGTDEEVLLTRKEHLRQVRALLIVSSTNMTSPGLPTPRMSLSPDQNVEHTRYDGVKKDRERAPQVRTRRSVTGTLPEHHRA
jgi:hypothetical protein